MFHRINLFICTGFIFTTLLCPYKGYGEIQIKPSLSMTESYDTNFFSESETQGSADTFITTIAPVINITYLQKKFSINAYYSHNLRYLSRTSELRDDGVNRSSFDMDIELSENSSISINDSFSFTEDDLTTTEETPSNIGEGAEVTGTGIQTRRTEKITNNFSLGLNQEITPKTSVNITIADSLEMFLDSALINSRTDSIALKGGYELTPNRSINIAYGYTNFYFDSPGGGENQGAHSFTAGFAELFSPTFSVNLSGGGTYSLEPEETFSWTASAGLTKTFQTSSASLNYNRGVTNTSGLTNETSINQTISLGWNVQLSETLDLGLISSASENSSISTNNVDTTSYRAGITGGWQVYKWMNAGFGYTRSQQFASGAVGNDILRDLVFINVTLIPIEWRF